LCGESSREVFVIQVGAKRDGFGGQPRCWSETLYACVDCAFDMS
jgi:hypothetical protein